MIVIPASLRSDFIHMAGMTIHIALESTIHIVGIHSRMVVTNSHVVNSCQAGDLEMQSAATDKVVKFVDLRRDPNRDLAILCVDKSLPFGLTAAHGVQPFVETEVETWGYPLNYGGRAPILSRGYVAGYSADVMPPERGGTGTAVSRLIVNGAFNPGNSGGPLIDRNSGKVVGIVVEKWNLWSPLIETVINGLQQSPKVVMSGAFSGIDADGKSVAIANDQAISLVLKEFYEKSQVMIGNAISVSELNTFIKEKGAELSCGVHQTDK